MTKTEFGAVGGTPVHEIVIRSKAGAEAKILTWGAVVRDLVVPAKSGPQRVVLGLNTIEDYVAHSPSFGAVPGRFANRIANGRFVLDGVTSRSTASPARNTRCTAGRTGSASGCGSSATTDEFSVALPLKSPDGDAGFPGALTATCVYRLLEPATLRVELTAVADKPTVVNLTHHGYFNLDGSPDMLDHEVTLFADFYTPSDAELIPTGEIRAVAGTPYDFRKSRSGAQCGPDALRHEFRRHACGGPGRAGADRPGPLAEERTRARTSLVRARRAVLRRGQTRRARPGPRGRALRPARRPLPRTAGLPGFAEPRHFTDTVIGRANVCGGQRVPVRVVSP